MIDWLGGWHFQLHLMRPGTDLLLHIGFNASLLLTGALLTALLGRRLGPALRHHLLTAGAVGAILSTTLIATDGMRASPGVFPADITEGVIGSPPSPIVVPAGSSWTSDPAIPTESPASGGGLLLLLWGAGAVVIATRASMSWMRVRAVLSSAMPIVDERWTVETNRIAERIGTRPPELVVVPAATSPFAFGVFRPRIAIDLGSFEAAPDVRHAILLHELAHLRRRDTAWALLASTLRVLFWPLPPAWWVASAMQLEAERACDQSVLEGGISRTGYMRQLMQFDAQVPQLGWSVSPLRSTELYRRLRSLGSDPLAVRPRAAVVLGIWGTLLALGIVLAGLEPAGGQAVFFADPNSPLMDSRSAP